MSNRIYRPDAKKTKQIADEVISKVQDYEKKMVTRLARWVEHSELYMGKTATQKENSKNSPNSAELFKAIRAIRNMTMRMILGQKPSFELEANDLIGHEDPKKLIKAEHYILQQMDLAKYPSALARTIDHLLLYGTVAVHNPYEPLRQPFLGKRQWVTSYRPVSLINCAFSLDTYDLADCGWVALSDIQSKKELDKILGYDPEGKIYNTAAIKECQNQADYQPTVNNWVAQRLAWQGYVNQKFEGGMERVTYYGPLDCLNDGEEYCIELVNREYIIRAETFEGLRPVRIQAINTIDVEPLGNGMGDMFRPLLTKVDDAEAALLNMITLAGANMYAKQKSLTDEDAEFAIRQFGVMSLENPQMFPVSPDANNLTAVASYVDVNIQRFRQASGATDTLQAIVSGEQATATATSLAMNESVRNISVMAETIAPNLHSDYAKMILQNAQKYNTEPLTVPIGGIPATILPADLLLDVNVRLKVTTDQDFRPAKLQRIREAIQLMAAFGPNAIPGKKINPGPALMEYLKTLDVPHFEDTIQDLTDEDLLKMRLVSEMGAPNSPQETEETSGHEAQEARANGERPGRREERTMRREMGTPMNTETMTTPIGEVMSAPGDSQESTRAIRKSSVGQGE